MPPISIEIIANKQGSTERERDVGANTRSSPPRRLRIDALQGAKVCNYRTIVFTRRYPTALLNDRVIIVPVIANCSSERLLSRN